MRKRFPVADKLEDAQRLLRDRIGELDSEREQLKTAIERLEAIEKGRTSPSRRSPRKRRAARRGRKAGTGKRARRGERERQLIASIGTDPDRRVTDHAREIGVRPQQLYPILSRLIKSDRLEKSDGRYRLKA
jgi:hypothetical protein